MRNLEESLFWEVFYRHQVVRSDLARLFDVSAATISRAAGVLLSKQLVVETGATISFRGRRPVRLQVNPELATLAGIEIDRDLITAAVTDMTGNLLGRGSVPTSPRDPVRDTLRSCAEAVRKAIDDADIESHRLSQIGVGHTGTIDVEGGVCLNWEGVPHWRRVNLVSALRQTFGVPVSLDDRARAIALAQHLLWPEHCRHRSAIYVQIGTGIGAGIFVNGRMLRGATSTGGELGHVVIDRNGPLCACGKRGCVEVFASRGATLNRVREAVDAGADTTLKTLVKSPSQLTIEMVISAARHGDALANSALAETVQALGIGVANAVQLLNPSLVVLTGKFGNAARDFFLDGVRDAISSQCFETIARGLEIRVAPVRKDIAPIGCALLASLDVGQRLVQELLFQPVPSFQPAINSFSKD